ncbi:MAG: efflux RND transporter periplasmic adaptor subunit [Planctomycetota bacterium]|nr:efflux RND transporter periplasmic adaptor subunit [Planctomycetota bacterium]
MIDVDYIGIGTVRANTQSVISGQVNGTVMETFVRDGVRVTKGQKLLKVDDREYMTVLREAEKGLEMAKVQLQQSRQTLLQAQAQYQQAVAGLRVSEQTKERAIQQLAAAEENFRRLKADFERSQKLFEQGTVTEQQFEAARAAYVSAKANAEQARIAIDIAKAGIEQAREAIKAAEAGKEQATSGVENAKLGVERAQEVLERARISLAYTVVIAPADGFIGQTFADTGDLVFPGKPLVEFYSRNGFEVQTYVRESLFEKVAIGDTYSVIIESIGYEDDAKVVEIIPSARPHEPNMTSCFKVELSDNDRIYPGMFARVRIPIDKRRAFLVPDNAIRRVGMLETVTVESDGLAVTRYVKTGERMLDGRVEVISGLSDGEVISVRGGERRTHPRRAAENYRRASLALRSSCTPGTPCCCWSPLCCWASSLLSILPERKSPRSSCPWRTCFVLRSGKFAFRNRKDRCHPA